MSFLLVLLVIAFPLALSFAIVNQGTVAGDYFWEISANHDARAKLQNPFVEAIKKISIQSRSIELEFQAITADQANVNFKAMLVYAVMNQEEETIKNVAFKFMDERSFMQALIRTIEGTIRALVATKRQAEVLGLRSEIVIQVKEHIDNTLETWGYHLIDLQLNDIAFDEAIMRSMAQIVASNNLKAAAENEGQALLITKTKAAEAEGNAIRIAAEG
jgi:regulator of protease activity HflC (stomatin/prohibitin superfamily)